MRRLLLPALLLVVLFSASAFAELPDFYKQVRGITWVVKDSDRVVQAWSKLGLTGVEQRGEMTLPIEFRGKRVEAKVKLTSGRFGVVNVFVIQPLGGRNAYTEYLASHGDGVFALIYRTPGKAAFDAEIARLNSLGVPVLQQVHASGGQQAGIAYLDTGKEGKYTLGLEYSAEPEPTYAPQAGDVRLTQYAFVIRDNAPVSKYWEKLGFPAFSITHPALTDLHYQGKPTSYAQDLGWQRHGKVPFEWCVPPKGASTLYEVYLKTHGEGVQHIAFEVADMDEAVARYAALGYKTVQGGGWGEKGKPGSGRFEYVDTDAAGGLTIELLWNHKGN